MTCDQSKSKGSNGKNWTIASGELDCEDVAALLALHVARMKAGSPPAACHVLPAEALRDPAVSFWTVREGGRLLGVGALKLLEAGHGEVKSMRVADDAVGRGVGRAILDHLVAEARRRGLTRLSLETGNSDEFQPAVRLYRSAGFDECGPFAGYHPTDFTIFLTRALEPGLAG